MLAPTGFGVVLFVRVGIKIREHHLGKPELAEVRNPRRVQAAYQVITLMLHHPRVEPRGNAHDGFALGVDTFVANMLVALYLAAQAGH